jgi:hypothetical protein
VTTYYVDPAGGDDANPGTGLDEAFASFGPVETDGRVALGPGDTVELRDTAVLYPPSKPIWCGTAGTADERITIRAYGDERPVIDCSNYDGHGIDLWGVQHMTWRGVVIRNVGKDAVRCSGTESQPARNCRFEELEIGHFGETSVWGGNGLGFYGHSYDHTIRDVTVHHGTGNGRSDGFYVGGSASTGRSGGHTFVRCEAYRNAANGFDFFENDPSRPSRLVGCRAHHNGDDGEGDGNGFKLGNGWGTGGNVLVRCLAWENATRGFDCNGASMRNEFHHCTAWRNGTYGFHFTGHVVETHAARNCAAFGNGSRDVGSLRNADTAHNTWDLGIERPSFVSTDPDSTDFLRPTTDSPLVDAGVETDGHVDVAGDSIDLGAVSATDRPAASRSEGVAIGDGGGYTGFTARNRSESDS